MNRAILVLVLVLAVVGGIIWKKKSGAEDAKPAEEKPAAEESRVKRDEEGRVIIKMDDEVQGNIGVLVAKPAAAKLSPEVKGYGRVLDPTSLATLLTELATAQAAYSASSNELIRMKTLTGQGNASERALQSGEAAARRDQLAIQSAKDRFSLLWGKQIADQPDLPAFVQSLTSLNAILVRIDLPAGEILKSPPAGARLETLSGNSVEAEFLGPAPNVDAQNQGRGFIFLIKANALRLLPGEAMTGFLKIPGEPLAGVIVPKGAVVRTEGTGWIYILNSGGDSFTRMPVSLDHPREAGWFVAHGVTTDDYIVVTGAQNLLSEELKATIKAD